MVEYVKIGLFNKDQQYNFEGKRVCFFQGGGRLAIYAENEQGRACAGVHMGRARDYRGAPFTVVSNGYDSGILKISFGDLRIIFDYENEVFTFNCDDWRPSTYDKHLWGSDSFVDWDPEYDTWF